MKIKFKYIFFSYLFFFNNLHSYEIIRDPIFEHYFLDLSIELKLEKIDVYLIKENSLIGNESKQKFYHLNTKEMYDKISNLIYWLKIIGLALFSSK